VSKPTERGQRRQSSRKLQRTDADDVLTPFYADDLSDEAAAHIAEFLMQLAMRFEETHFSTIRRHYQSIKPKREPDPRQLDLFPHDPPF